MTADNLLHFLQQPEDLRRVSYEELKTLALEYPYCPHVHQLLLYKSRMVQHKDYAQDLARAAAQSLDRAMLRQRMLHWEAVLAPAAEVLELMPAAELEARLSQAKIPLEPPAVEVPATAVSPAAEANPPSFQEGPEVLAQAAPFSTEDAPAPPPSNAEVWSSLPEDAPAPPLSNAEEWPPAPEALPAPMAKTAFRTWNRLHAPLPPLSEPATASFAPPPAATTTPATDDYSLPDLRKLAEQSVELKTDVVSESLAALLVRQGHIQSAIHMYERLCLLFPQKSAYFAAQIENLKKTS